MLALYPEYQEKVYQEILSVIPDKDAEFTQSDLDKLEFTELCIRETLRLFPAVPLIARTTSKSITLSNGVEIPPNVPIVCGIRHIQIQEKYYGPTAKIFNPYRFNDDHIKNLHACTYIPFSYGSRNWYAYYINYTVYSIIQYPTHKSNLSTIDSISFSFGKQQIFRSTFNHSYR